MDDGEQDRTHPLGEALYRELEWVHAALRRDLETVNGLADRVLAGASREQVASEVSTLQTTTPLWQLKANCLTYCRFVHGHHNLEDVALFPGVRKTNPELSSEVDRLEADHREIARFVGDVEATAERIADADTPAARQGLAEALRVLSRHLLAHLDFEEETIGPAMRRWEREPWA